MRLRIGGIQIQGVPLHIPEFGRLLQMGDEQISIIPSLIHYSSDNRTWIGSQVIQEITREGGSEEQIREAVEAGATLCTHLGNGASNVLPLRSNCIWEQLADDRLAACFIADGVHLDAAFLKAAVRAKGTDRSVLVTDSAAPAGIYRIVPGVFVESGDLVGVCLPSSIAVESSGTCGLSWTQTRSLDCATPPICSRK